MHYGIPLRDCRGSVADGHTGEDMLAFDILHTGWMGDDFTCAVETREFRHVRILKHIYLESRPFLRALVPAISIMAGAIDQ